MIPPSIFQNGLKMAPGGPLQRLSWQRWYPGQNVNERNRLRGITVPSIGTLTVTEHEKKEATKQAHDGEGMRVSLKNVLGHQISFAIELKRAEAILL